MKGIEPTLDRIRARAPHTPGAVLRPARFFLAGSGVLTLAFRGFTAGLLDLKDHIRPGLAPEYPGSLWPKITLAALANPSPLSPEEIGRIQEACTYADARLLADGESMVVRQMVVVEALTRSLEMRGTAIHIHLSTELEQAVPAPHERFVDGVLAQWDWPLKPTYVAAIRRSGHGREHYQRPCRAFTLVAFPSRLPPGVAELRDRLSRTLPGRYHWFDPAALHLTLRTLEPAPDSEFEPVELLTQDHLDA